jgi:hypothetical protein
MTNNKNKSMDDILRDTKHNKKLKEIFLRLLAKQKSKHRDWSDVRAETLPSDKPDIRNELDGK